ncbi:MAG TPA: hypothetical protein VGX71_06130 [Pseudaminobacter sp.]|nr:hypothetical protein [Pseudaminobacter sp.]
MTTIVYRDGIMATDSRAFSGHRSPIGFKKKLHVLPNGALVASSSSDVGRTDAFAKWCIQAVNEGHPLPACTHDSKIGVQALLVWTDGTVYYWNSRCFTGPLEAPFFAIGSGWEFALGALHAGATAEEAVRIASECDSLTGGPIQTAKLSPISNPPNTPISGVWP